MERRWGGSTAHSGEEDTKLMIEWIGKENIDTEEVKRRPRVKRNYQKAAQRFRTTRRQKDYKVAKHG